MANLLLGATVCACGILLGLGIRRLYRVRYEMARDYRLLVTYLQEQIAYCLTPLPRLMNDFAALHPGALANALRDYPTLPAATALPPAQWREMAAALSTLGQSDVEGQKRRLSALESGAEAWRQQAEQATRTKGALYAKLCILGGVALMIVMM